MKKPVAKTASRPGTATRNSAPQQRTGNAQRQAQAAPKTQTRQATPQQSATRQAAPQQQRQPAPVQSAQRLPAVRKQAPPPAVLDDLDEMMMADAGTGVSTAAEDNIVPNILVLQPLSPECDEKDPKYIEGAKPGDIYLRGMGIVIPGTEGIWFQPVEMFNKWLEFIARDKGGGFVAGYDFSENIDRQNPPGGAERDNKNPNKWRFPEADTECVHYHFVVGFLWDNQNPMEYVIPFKSTGHTVAKQWNTTRLRQRFPNGKSMPAAANLYHLTTARKKNKHGTWHVFEIGNAMYIGNVPGTGMPSPEAVEVIGEDAVRAYTIARSLASAVSSGQKIIAVDDDEAVGDADTGDGGGDAMYNDQQGDQGGGEQVPF